MIEKFYFRFFGNSNSALTRRNFNKVSGVRVLFAKTKRQRFDRLLVVPLTFHHRITTGTQSDRAEIQGSIISVHESTVDA